MSKIVDDILICGEDIVVDRIFDMLKDRFTLGTIVHGPRHIRCFGLNIIQYDDYTVSINGDDKLFFISSAPMTRTRRRQVTESLSSVEKNLFASINSSVAWLGITASLFRALFSGLFQQSALMATVAMLCNQAARLGKLQQTGRLSHHCRPDDSNEHTASLIVFFAMHVIWLILDKYVTLVVYYLTTSKQTLSFM